MAMATGTHKDRGPKFSLDPKNLQQDCEASLGHFVQYGDATQCAGYHRCHGGNGRVAGNETTWPYRAVHPGAHQDVELVQSVRGKLCQPARWHDSEETLRSRSASAAVLTAAVFFFFRTPLSWSILPVSIVCECSIVLFGRVSKSARTERRDLSGIIIINIISWFEGREN